MNNIHFQYDLKSSDGLTLFAQGWKPSRNIKAVILLIHGVGEHSSRYKHVAEFLNEKGYALTAFDHRGHGKSEGRRGYLPSCELLLDDISIHLRESSNHYPDLPYFLYGHSLGGNLVINYILRRDSNFSGVIVTAPLLKLAFEPSKALQFVSSMLIKIWPTLSLKSGLKTSDISRDPEVVRAYDEDPLTHDRITPGFLKFMEAGEWALTHASEFSIPLLLMHGSEDHITSPENSSHFGRDAGVLCTLKIRDGFYHELHNEPEKEPVLKTMTDWLDKYI